MMSQFKIKCGSISSVLNMHGTDVIGQNRFNHGKEEMQMSSFKYTTRCFIFDKKE